MDMLSTIRGSMMEGFYPKGWNLELIQECCNHADEEVFERQDFWNEGFYPISCKTVKDFNVKMGHEMAYQIAVSRMRNEKLVMILPVGPIGIYEWCVYFLKNWKIDCKHLYCFNMDEWSDAEGNTLPEDQQGSFKGTMEAVFYNPLGELTVPENQRNFATKENLVQYQEKIQKLRNEGARMITVFGIGRDFHVAFCEPHFAEFYTDDEAWKREAYWIGAKLHPLSIEQNAIYSFRSNFTNVPCYANTIGPALFLNSDYVIGGVDGALGRGASLQGVALWVTLRHGPTRWIPSSYMPTLPGRLFFVKKLAERMVPDVH